MLDIVILWILVFPCFCGIFLFGLPKQDNYSLFTKLHY
jgi:hypothetical protein